MGCNKYLALAALAGGQPIYFIQCCHVQSGTRCDTVVGCTTGLQQGAEGIDPERLRKRNVNPEPTFGQRFV